MAAVADESVELIVTSPPYPMIKMWDEMFAGQNSSISELLAQNDGPAAFELMHRLLDEVWKEAYRVLKPGGFVCVNIGDATRTINGHFALYTNHARILNYAQSMGFLSLPCILWRKQSNAPNKFMGSGMLPAGAYVTLEHEYILVLRKGPKREFKSITEKETRRQSAIFWEERNLWYSDIWFDIKGIAQKIKDPEGRKRSAAFPLELAHRLVNMYSVKGDTVLDPFAGTGTTALAAMVSARNSIGYEIDDSFQTANSRSEKSLVARFKKMIHQRLLNHLEFVRQRMESKGNLKYTNSHYGFPVLTAQEKELLINDPVKINNNDNNSTTVEYSDKPQPAFCKEWGTIFQSKQIVPEIEKLKKS